MQFFISVNGRLYTLSVKPIPQSPLHATIFEPSSGHWQYQYTISITLFCEPDVLSCFNTGKSFIFVSSMHLENALIWLWLNTANDLRCMPQCIGHNLMTLTALIRWFVSMYHLCWENLGSCTCCLVLCPHSQILMWMQLLNVTTCMQDLKWLWWKWLSACYMVVIKPLIHAHECLSVWEQYGRSSSIVRVQLWFNPVIDYHYVMNFCRLLTVGSRFFDSISNKCFSSSVTRLATAHMMLFLFSVLPLISLKQLLVKGIRKYYEMANIWIHSVFRAT